MRRPRRPASPPARTVEVVISSLGAQGDGVAEYNGQPLYVPLSLSGERMRVRTGAKRGEGLEAEIVEILEASPERVAPPCPYFGTCGGCQLQHLRPEAYRAWKWGLLADTLKRGGLEGVELEPLAVVPDRSRRRAAFAVKGQAVGFHQRRSHGVVEIADCLLLRPEITALLAPFSALLREVRGVSGIVATLTEAGVDVLLTGSGSPDLAQRECLVAFAERVDLARLSWQGDVLEPIAARRPPVITFGGVAVEPPPGAFLQPSREGEAFLRDAVLAGVGKATSIADLYCGLGSFTFPLAEGGRKVVGMEGAVELIAALKAAADKARLPHVRALVRDLTQRPLLAPDLTGFDAVVFDPPRAGAKVQVEAFAQAGAPPTLVAVSCNPATFLRDSRTLTDAGWRCTALTPVDQFPYSSHLEVVGVFHR